MSRRRSGVTRRHPYHLPSVPLSWLFLAIVATSPGGMFSQYNNNLCDLDSITVHDIDFELGSGTYGNFTYGDYLQELQELEQGRTPMKVDRTAHPTPRDLTNLHWLHNVPVALDQAGAARQQAVTLMVDPNTNLPVHFTTARGTIPTLQPAAMGFITMPGHPAQQLLPHQAHHLFQRHDIHDMRQQALAGQPKYMPSDKGKENGTPGQKVFPKPVFSYSCLIAMALKNSEDGSLPVSEIYKYMQSRFPYFKTAPDGWKNSVRHNLSLNKAFCKLERPDGTSQRKGCLWSLKPEKREQLEREIRKWKKKHPEAIKASMANPDDLSLSSDSLDDDSLEDRKTPSPEHTVPESSSLDTLPTLVDVAEGGSRIKEEPIDELAVENAAKELFGNDLLFQDDLQPEEFWNELMTSSENTTLLDQLQDQYSRSITEELEEGSSSSFTIKPEPGSPDLSNFSHSPAEDLDSCKTAVPEMDPKLIPVSLKEIKLKLVNGILSRQGYQIRL